MKTSFVQVLELFWGLCCINMRYLLLLFVAQGICAKTLRASDARFYRQKIAAGKTTWWAEHNVLIEQTELSFPGSHEHKTPGVHVSCPFTYLERKRPLPWPVKQWSSWTSVHRPRQLSRPAAVELNGKHSWSSVVGHLLHMSLRSYQVHTCISFS